jgi:hypothetical protein
MDETRDTLERVTKKLLEYYDEFGLDEGFIDETRELLGLVHQLTNVACSKCGGTGYRAYGSTSTWRGGIGGQAITSGICDSCWGSGRSDKTFGNLRLIKNM